MSVEGASPKDLNVSTVGQCEGGRIDSNNI